MCKLKLCVDVSIAAVPLVCLKISTLLASNFRCASLHKTKLNIKFPLFPP